MTRELTCIICPRGCKLTVEIEDKQVKAVTGNVCNRGKKYAEDECVHPVRTVTSTVKTVSGILVSVKTDRPIPREKVFECMELINSAIPASPIKCGDIIIADVFGANIIATSNT